MSAATAAILMLSTSIAGAATLEDIFKVSAEGNQVAQASQVTIDGISDETAKLLAQYKTLLKEIEGLRIYNAQVQRQIDEQNRTMTKLRDSIDNVTLIERQIMPLMLRMVDALEEFVELDMPFLLDERRDRIANLRGYMDDSEISASEKFRIVFEAYQIENDYGRTNFTNEGPLSLGGSEYQGTFLRIGRVGLYFQNSDASITAVWNKTAGPKGSWQQLDDDYSAAISQGIQITKQQVQPDLIRIPIVAPQ